MEQIKLNLSNFQIKKVKNEEYEKKRVLAEEIWNYFGKTSPFQQIMFLINKFGQQWVYECYNEIKQRKVGSFKLLVWKCNQVKIKWN